MFFDKEKYIDDLVSKVSTTQRFCQPQRQVDKNFKRVHLKMSSLRIPLAQISKKLGWYGRQSYQKPFRHQISTTNIKTPKTCSILEEDPLNSI